MALLKCHDCGKDVSTEAKQCPNCGAPVRISDVEGVETLGVVMLILPICSSFLIWFWIGQMPLLQGPGSKLNFLCVLTVIGTAILATIEGNKIGIGKPLDSGKKINTPLEWFILILVFWVIAYPAYFWARSKYGLKNQLLGGILITALFIWSSVSVGLAINQQVQKVQEKLNQAVQQFESIKNISSGYYHPNKPLLKWQDNLKLANNSVDSSYGYRTYKFEVENIGQNIIKDAKFILYLKDSQGNVVITKTEPLVWSWGDPMRPGEIKQFTIMVEDLKSRSITDTFSYLIDINDYEASNMSNPQVTTPPVNTDQNTQAQTDSRQTDDIGTSYAVNVPNSQGGYTTITITKVRGGFMGQNGETYTDFPSIEELQKAYGLN